MNITIKTIPHNEQRYPTCGDWWVTENGDLEVRISSMNNPYYEWFVAEHEINEALLCMKDGVKGKDVDAFDIKFEKLREENPDLIGDQEPGNMVSAPYNLQHEAATRIEKITCEEFNEDWDLYDKAINSL